MRLIFVSHSLPPEGRPLASIGGMQRVALELHRALLDTDRVSYQPLMLRASWRWVHVRVLPFLFSTYRRLKRAVEQDDVDVILFSSMVTASLAVPLRRSLEKHGVRAAAIVHGQDVTKPIAAYQRWVPKVFRALDLVMPVSAATGEQCVERGLPPERVHVVHNGVDVERFEQAEVHPEAMRNALPEGALLLSSVGRQVKRKGFAWFVRNVMPKLPDHVHYWMAGDGPESEDIEAAISETGLERRVLRLGRVTEQELLDLYSATDLYVMPNIPVPGDMEGFGIVMLEAGMMGTPTVAARLEGIREVVTEGENGYFVETGDADGFARRIRQLDADREELAELSRRTREHVLSTFSWSAVAANYLDALERIS